MAPPRSALMRPNRSTLLLASRIFSDQIFLPNGYGVSTPEKFSNPSRGHTDNWAQGRAAIHPTDILARDIGGRMVVLENQFGLTDHTHLGQIMTYVTLREAKPRCRPSFGGALEPAAWRDCAAQVDAESAEVR